MKGLTIEQKAQRYDEAIEKTSKLIDEGCLNRMTGEFIFTELKEESEDEKIRKWLIALIKSNEYGSISNVGEMPCSKLNVLTWLEKQGEQKLETPKFHEGDWIVCCDYEPVQIISIGANAYYEMSNGDSRPCYMVDDNPNIRLWTIKDAKDGDVLVYGDNPNDHHVEVIMIFKSLRNENSAFTYFHIFDNEFKINDWSDCGKNTHPATKEQRDTLMKAMADAGWEFDFKKKKLKNIDQNSTTNEYSAPDNSNLDEMLRELNRSKDEKIKNWLIEYLYKEWNKYDDRFDDQFEDAINWVKKQNESELPKDFGNYINELSKQFPEVSFAKLSRIAVRIKNWIENQDKQIYQNDITSCNNEHTDKLKKVWNDNDKKIIKDIKYFLDDARNTIKYSDNDKKCLVCCFNWLDSLNSEVKQ